MNKFKSKILGFECHAYAPELNKVIFKSGNYIKAPQAPSLEYALKHYKKPIAWSKRACITVKHTMPEHKFCDKEYSGVCGDYKRLKDTLQKLKSYHNLNDAVITVTSIQTIHA